MGTMIVPFAGLRRDPFPAQVKDTEKEKLGRRVSCTTRDLAGQSKGEIVVSLKGVTPWPSMRWVQIATGKPTSPPPKTLAHVLPPILAPMSIGNVPRVLSYPNLGVWDKDFLPRGPFLQELGVEGV